MCARDQCYDSFWPRPHQIKRRFILGGELPLRKLALYLPQQRDDDGLVMLDPPAAAVGALVLLLFLQQWLQFAELKQRLAGLEKRRLADLCKLKEAQRQNAAALAQMHMAMKSTPPTDRAQDDSLYSRLSAVTERLRKIEERVDRVAKQNKTMLDIVCGKQDIQDHQGQRQCALSRTHSYQERSIHG